MLIAAGGKNLDNSPPVAAAVAVADDWLMLALLLSTIVLVL